MKKKIFAILAVVFLATASTFASNEKVELNNEDSESYLTHFATNLPKKNVVQ